MTDMLQGVGAVEHRECLDVKTCGQQPGHKCVTPKGKDTTPHAGRWRDGGNFADGYNSRQPEVDTLTQQVTSLKAENDQLDSTLASSDAQLAQLVAQNTDLRRRVTEAAEDLATAQQKILDLQDQLAALEVPPVEVLIAMNLNAPGVSLGPATAVGMGKAFGQSGKIGADSTWRDFEIAADPDGRRFLRWTSRRNTEGSANGISLAIKLARPVDDATYECDMRFSPGFGPSMGGKTPGPSMTVPGESGTKAGGGVDPGDTADSARGMWLAAAAGTFPQPDGTKRKAQAPFELTDYIYQKAKVEQERMTGFVPPTGQVITARRRVKMNTVGKADGLLQSWYGVKGQPLQVGRDDQAETWRTRPDLQVSHLFWSIFRGGPNDAPAWADNDDTPDWIDFYDGLTITTPAA